ncbi:MAG: biopolymer transporter ExbD [Gammaproteobacteria bacterium]
MKAFHLQQRRTRQKRTRAATLNLVSLMDIFTILVFFLMVNSSDVQVLDTNSSIKLPDSNAEKRPDERIVISINADDVVVQGRKVADVAAVLRSRAPLIGGLKDELDYQANRRKRRMATGKFEGRVTIMGDRELPYELLKKIMLTCQQADFTQIALAVNQVAEGESVGG